MTSALLFKEWKKTKWFAIGAFAVGLALLTYIFLKLGRSFRMVGLEHLWDVIVNRDQFLFRDVKYFPLATGFCLALAQFVPEMIQKRIKLSLHLPLSNRKIVFSMLGFGLLALLSIFVLHLIVILTFSVFYFPMEIIESMVYTLLPWYVAGLTAYAFMSWICLEPTWKRRVFNALLMLASLQLCFLSDFPGAYSLVVLAILLIPFYVLPFGYFSVQRFKVGIQD
ncbi:MULTISPECIES: hypothetical protein [Marinifilum]|uniref:hypothetical protein n=1 Tax=Marinifilum TaxID=866673 RepID=UPI0024953E93|nr:MULTISPECIES: hypothetical protein [Marinifilum]